uniref:C-type lectin domain-containing protein n=1 Tax=Pundamilia nyererei TaxID=303518 RepID=A0A3B4FA52_9CICH
MASLLGEDLNLCTTIKQIMRQNETFVFIDKTMTWAQAQSYCRAHHTDLASARNVSENRRVKELVPAGDRSAWIGLFRDSWKWADGRTSTFRYWKTKEPNNQYWRENCVAAYFKHSGNWEDWNCDWKKPFVCYSGKP